MEMINGYTVIASRLAEPDTGRGWRVILAVRDLSPSYTGHEYVTAVAAPREQNPTEWAWGHYFRDSLHPDTAPAISVAVEDFRNR